MIRDFIEEKWNVYIKKNKQIKRLNQTKKKSK